MVYVIRVFLDEKVRAENVPRGQRASFSRAIPVPPAHLVIALNRLGRGSGKVHCSSFDERDIKPRKKRERKEPNLILGSKIDGNLWF